MAIAGRVAIVPKGDWSADATYKRLDAVTHNNTLYFAKKDVPAGTETSNTEYWSKSVVGGEATVDDTISSESTNPVQNKVVKAYVDKKASENVDFSTSTSKLLNDSIEAPLVLSNATINLLNPTLQTTTQNGITCTNNGDGTYTLNGTAGSSTVFFNINEEIPLEVGKTYKLVCLEQRSDNYFSSIRYSDKTDPIKTTDGVFTAPTDKAFLYVAVHGGRTVNNEIVKPMITTDLSATYDDFVPYSGYDIKTCGKNLFGIDKTVNDITDKIGRSDEQQLKVIKLSDNSFKASPKTSKNSWLTCYFEILIDDIRNNINDYEIIYTVDHNDTGHEVNVRVDFDDKYKRYTVSFYLIQPTESVDLSKYIQISNIILRRKGSADTFEPYKDGGTVHIDSTTKFPLLGLKSFNGTTNIISPGNVEVTYAKSDSGKAILDMSENKLDKDNVVNNQTTTEEGFALDARQANPNLDGTLAKQISDLNGSLNNVIPTTSDCDLVTTHLAISNNALNNPQLSGVVSGTYALILTVCTPTPQPYNQQIAFVAGGDEIALRACRGDGKWGAWKKINVN